jgi:hypothetical protein
MNASPSARPWYGHFGANPDGWFDPQRGAATAEAAVANMQRAGVRLARVEFPWFLIEPVRRGFDWSRVDHIVSTVKDAGLRLHVQALYPPAWTARGSTVPGPACRVVTETFASGVPRACDYGAFVTALVQHVQDTNPGGLPYLEIGNEYDLSHYFNATPAEYVESQLIPGYRAAKAADPTVTVLLAGWGRPTNTDWFQAIVNAGGGGHFDVVSFHRYGDGPSVLAAAAENRAYLDGHGFSEVPLWVSEFGTVEGGTEDTGHQATIEAVFTGDSALQAAEWYEMHDDDVYGTATSICQREPFGLVDHDATATKAGYLTWQTVCGGGATAAMGASEFACAGVWARSDDGESLRSERAGSTATLSFLGNRIRVFANLSAAGGPAELSVDGGPWTRADTFCQVVKTDQEIWDSGLLASGTHTLTVRVGAPVRPPDLGNVVELSRAVVQSASPATVNDATTGAGENEVGYTGTWQATTGARDGRYGGTSHRSNTAGSTATMTFVGSRVAVRMNVSPDGGCVHIQVDAGAATVVDTHAESAATDRQVWTSGPLPYDRHTVTLRVLGTSTVGGGAWVDLDRFDVA